MTIAGFLPALNSSAVGTTEESELRVVVGSVSESETISSGRMTFIGTLTGTGFSLASRVPISVKSTLAPGMSGMRSLISRTVCTRSLECIPLNATV